MNRFDRINAAIEGAEGSIITLITTLIPWLAPLLPAYLTGSHLVNDLDIPLFFAVAMAATVEFLGLAAIATAFAAMRHNREQAAEQRQVSLAFPVIAYVWYLVIILVVNVVFSLPLRADWQTGAHVLAIALLTTLSAPAFVVAVARQDQHKQEQAAEDAARAEQEQALLAAQTAAARAEVARAAAERAQAEAATARANARVARAAAQAERAPAKRRVQVAQFSYDDFVKAMADRNGAGPLTVPEIQEQFSRSRRTAYKWLERYYNDRDKSEDNQ